MVDALGQRGGERLGTAQDQTLVALLTQLSVTLEGAGEQQWARSLAARAAEARRAGDDVAGRGVVRSVLGMYAGAGSLSDVVLQDRDGVRPEQAELDHLRQRLFEAARRLLGDSAEGRAWST